MTTRRFASAQSQLVLEAHAADPKDSLSEPPYGTSWITFKPEAAIVPGTITLDHARQIVERVAASASAPDVDVTLVDRTNERPDWW